MEYIKETLEVIKKSLTNINLGVFNDKIIGLDSLKIVELLLVFEEEFDVHIPDDFAIKLHTLTLEEIAFEIDNFRRR
ncbi:phosphopantetheine-binding protein [Ligilactobacillus apodemi]|uniref:phosphopantetheine-binding protein n=1 Tax=Ligilactobacillus apodemi TaxID=307126 RepID=UPI00214C7969|nr:phosphopantetheine-binding protein [Ligilactobacillus apodemi]